MFTAIFITVYVIWRVVAQCALVGLFVFVLSRVHGVFEISVVSGIAFLIASVNGLSSGAAFHHNVLLQRLRIAGLALARDGEDLDSILSKEIGLLSIEFLGGRVLQAIAVVAVIYALLS